MTDIKVSNASERDWLVCALLTRISELNDGLEYEEQCINRIRSDIDDLKSKLSVHEASAVDLRGALVYLNDIRVQLDG